MPWGNKEFANAVGAKSSEGVKNERTIRNWRKGDTHPSPADFHGIMLAIFGTNDDYAAWKSELTDKYHAGRNDDPDRPLPALAPQRIESRPTKPLRCLGRDDDLALVVAGLTASSGAIAILVLGGAGMGKTTLTRQAANEPAVVARFDERRWFVELETAPDAMSVETAIVTALGLDPAQTKISAALAQLAAAPGLLVLDNLETPFEGTQTALEELLARLHQVPGVALLASIRGNEPPHGVRWSRQRTMNPLYDPFDRELFLDIANDIKPDDPDLAPLLAELGGVPLAIELVAHQAASHDTLAAIRAQWQKVGVALAQRRGVERSRLNALDHSLELSVQSARLGGAGRRLFGFLGISPAGLCRDDIDGLLGEDAFAARQGVLDCGLGFERDGRLDLLPPVRDFAVRHHAPPADDAKNWRTHFLALAETHGEQIGKADGAAALRRIGDELPNLDKVLRASIACGESTACTCAVHGIGATIRFTGLGSPRALRELSDALRAARDAEGEPHCLFLLGLIATDRSDLEAARKAYEEALPLYRNDDNNLGEANCTHALGDIALLRSDLDAALKAFEEALPLYRQIGDILGEANCIRSLGDIALERSDLEVARTAYEEALPLYRQIGVILGEANCIQALGNIAVERSDSDAARNAYEEALQLYRQTGQILGEANCILNLGSIALKRSDHYVARKAYEEALALFERVADPYSIGCAHELLARVTEGVAQTTHLAAAREAWGSISRDDLVEKWLDNDASEAK